MKSLHIFWLFYKRLLVPVWALSFLLGAFSGEIARQIVGISLIIFGLIFHYFVYEVRFPGEYYFYHNLGWGKQKLWISTSAFHIFACLILISL